MLGAQHGTFFKCFDGGKTRSVDVVGQELFDFSATLGLGLQGIHLTLGARVFRTLRANLLASAVVDPQNARAVQEAPQVSLGKIVMKLWNVRHSARGAAESSAGRTT
jgi:hypothetical protein